MQNKQLLKSIGMMAVGLILGGTALVFAADWTAPDNQPPTCPSGSPGCDAPINVSGKSQAKQGALAVGSTVLPDIYPGNMFVVDNGNATILGKLKTLGFMMTTGAAPNKVLTVIDNEGNAEWRNLPTPPDEPEQYIYYKILGSPLSYGTAQVQVSCDTGDQVIAGGCAPNAGYAIDSHFTADRIGWRCSVTAASQDSPTSVIGHAVCIHGGTFSNDKVYLQQ